MYFSAPQGAGASCYVSLSPLISVAMESQLYSACLIDLIILSCVIPSTLYLWQWRSQKLFVRGFHAVETVCEQIFHNHIPINYLSVYSGAQLRCQCRLLLLLRAKISQKICLFGVYKDILLKCRWKIAWLRYCMAKQWEDRGVPRVTQSWKLYPVYVSWDHKLLGGYMRWF